MTQTLSRSSNGGNGSGLDPAEIRRIVALGKERGLISCGGPAVITRNGLPAAAEGGVLSQWMDITPELATQWLENNFRNRPLSDDTVAAYARDMAGGNWVSTHQGIAFNDKDELIDGQHRLHAIVRSGKTVRMMVTFGLPSVIEGKEMTTMDAVDRGRTRSVSDQLKIQHGLKDGTFIAAICASLGNICHGQKTRRLSVGQTLEIYRAFEPHITWMIANRTKEHGLRATGVAAGFVFAMAAERTGLIQAVFLDLVSDKPIHKSQAIGHLRKFLVSDDARLLTRGNDRALAELVLQAIHLQLKGKPIVKLEIAEFGLNHFRALQQKRVEKIGKLFKLPNSK